MPIVKRRKGESNTAYRGRLIDQQMKEGKGQAQAVAIGYSYVPETRGSKKRGKRT